MYFILFRFVHYLYELVAFVLNYWEEGLNAISMIPYGPFLRIFNHLRGVLSFCLFVFNAFIAPGL